MRSHAATNLLLLASASEVQMAHVYHRIESRQACPLAYGVQPVVERKLRTLAAQIIAGEYPVLKNVVSEPEAGLPSLTVPALIDEMDVFQNWIGEE